MALQQNFINFSYELAHVLLDVYDSWGKRDTMGLALFRQKQILTGLLVTKITKKMKISLFSYASAWLHLTNNNFLAFISIEEILDQTIFLKPHTRMDIKHPTQECFKFTIIRYLCRFL